VQVSLARFARVAYDAARETARIGAGQVWNGVYAALAPLNRTVVGGRSVGVGVGGFLLGGGESRSRSPREARRR
jgi:FAD/FMN-containing dehydrogenase